MKKWQERALEFGRDLPVDLSGACKFCSQFAVKIFGGTVKGHFFHQWVEFPDGKILDLAEDAEDVMQMLCGTIPKYAQQYARITGKTLPDPFYIHNNIFMNSKDCMQSNLSIQARVDAWVQAFPTLLFVHQNSRLKTSNVKM